MCIMLSRKSQNVSYDLKQIKEELYIKGLIIKDARKKNINIITDLNNFKKLYEHVKQERNCFVGML